MSQDLSNEKSYLEIGSYCSIYSRSKDKWYDAKIEAIDGENQNEWLTVRYGNKWNKIKKIQRNCKDLKPISSNHDIEEIDTDEKEEKINKYYAHLDDKYKETVFGSVSVKLLNNDKILLLKMFGGSKNQSVFNPEFNANFDSALEYCEQLNGEKVLIIVGTNKYFSLGLDLKYMGENLELLPETAAMISKTYKKLLTLNMPTIAAINGHAFGAGAFIAMCCDYRYMRSKAGFICFPEVKLQINLGSGWIELLQSKLLPNTFRTAILTSKKWTPAESEKAQIIDEEIYCGEYNEQCDIENSCNLFIDECIFKHGVALIEFSKNRQNYQRLKREMYYQVCDGLDKHISDPPLYGMNKI